ncbi:hypothetical protein BJX61DRAFT_552128 [Aspergillus egyptiacus]|nr:hypothetical protein BJX61DRAFT_552128 [Aspergillus egyptiacus]
MMTSLPLLRGASISLADALADDDNILHRLDLPRKQDEFWTRLRSYKSAIEDMVSFHLRVSHCHVADEADWLSGSYNVCIPVQLNPPSDERVLVRIPLPFKIATYIWIREHCPTVPVPFLYGFSFPTGVTYAVPASVSFWSRLRWNVIRTVRTWLGLPPTCPYIRLERSSRLPTGYMIISFVGTGQMLSNTLPAHLLNDKIRRNTLFHDLAKIILSLNRTPLPRIGSLTLTNRPLTLRLQNFENEAIPTIPRASASTSTYDSIEPYLLDLLQLHNNRITHQPNAIHDLQDGQEQLAALTMMRALLPDFISRTYRTGPFVLTLTDLHPSNIFVDDDWHITSLFDLEWACSFPVEMQTPPYWLSGRSIDDIEHGENLRRFDEIISSQGHHEYSAISHAGIMRRCWESGAFWYFQAVQSPKGLLRVFNEHIQRRFCEGHCTQRVFDRVVSHYWCVGAEGYIQRKVEEARYKDRLRRRFGEVGH